MTDTINSISAIVIGYFSSTLIMNTIFLTVALCAMLFLRRTSARARYNIGVIGLIKIALPPFIAVPIAASIRTPQLFSYHNLIPLTTPEQSSRVVQPALHPQSILFIIWAAIVVLIFLYILQKAFYFSCLTKKIHEIKSQNFHTTRAPIYMCGNIGIPMTIGMFFPKILVPPTWHSWSSECRQLVIDHELAHIKRRDGLVQTLQIIIQAIFFFHPFVWLLNRHLNELREMACDDIAMQKKSSSLHFSKCLVQIAENMVQNSLGHPSASALIRQKKHLLKRVKYQFEERKMKTNKLVVIASTTMIVVLFFISSITFTQVPQAAPAVATDDSTIFIYVQSDGTIQLDSNKVPYDVFAQEINETIRQRKGIKYIHFDVEPDTPMGVVQDINKTLQEVDLLNISFGIVENEKINLILPVKNSDQHFEKINVKNKCLILINQQGNMIVDEKPRNHTEMKRYVSQRLAENPNLVIDITIAPKAPAQYMITIMEELKQLGAKRISTGAQKKRKPGRKYD